MHDAPDKELLLTAVAEFLMNEARPALADPRLNFRALIAAHLCNVVIGELRTGAAQDAAELARLQALLPGVPGDTAALNRVLAARLRDGTLSGEAVRAHVKETLREKLSVNNPMFDLRQDVD